MVDVDRYFHLLEREDVTEIVLQSDKVAGIVLDTGIRALSKEPVTSSAIVSALQDWGVIDLLPTGDSSNAPESVTIRGHEYDLILARRGNVLKVRLAHPGTWVERTAATEAVGRAGLTEVPAPLGRIAVDAASQPEDKSQPASVEPLSLELQTPKGRGAGSAKPRPDPSAQAAATTIPHELFLLLEEAHQRHASDVHISAENQVRMRIVGRLAPQGEVLSAAAVSAMLSPLFRAEEWDQLEKHGYTDFAMQIPDVGRLRVNVNRQRTGMKGCFRLIPETPPTLEELGLPDDLRKITNYHQGLAVVSGPNGMGKTTTMAALVDLINSERAYHIITVEDPVEYMHPIKRAVLSQRQVGDHTDSFETALKGALREDPDVIIIGELRDKETVAMAMSAAETGHLVIATMSTPSAAKTIDRLIDMFPPEDQAQVRATLAGALKLVISQRLVNSVDGTRLFAAPEIITGGMPLWNLIRDNKLFQLNSLQQRGRNAGMLRIEDSLNELLEKGLISAEAARANASDPRLIKVPGETPARAPAAPAAPADTPDAAAGRFGFFGRKG